MHDDRIVFPPQDEAAFAEKLARWKARGPKPPKRRNLMGKDGKAAFGRVATHEIPKDQFLAHIRAEAAARRRQWEENILADLKRIIA